MSTNFGSMDDVFDRLIELDENGDFYWVDGDEDPVGCLRNVMQGKDKDWLACSYVMYCTWDDGGRGYGPCHSLQPINSELDGVIDAMQSSLDHAGGDWGVYDVRLIDVETGKVYRPQIMAIELTESKD